MIPKLAKEYDAEGDYYDVLLSYLEASGEKLKVPEFRIITDRQLLDDVMTAAVAGSVDITPKSVIRLG